MIETTDHYETPAVANHHNLPYQEIRFSIPLNKLRPMPYTAVLTNTTSALAAATTALQG